MPKLPSKKKKTKTKPAAKLNDLERAQQSVKQLAKMLSMVEPFPVEWLDDVKLSAKASKVETLTCTRYRDMTMAWRKALQWTDGLDFALACMLASIISTNSLGDQLWLKIIGPASCGKSTLCEAVSVADEYVIAKSTIRGFHSGYTLGEGGEDFSLISKIKNKTLVTKDGDTLLQSPNLSQILSEARDIYDTVSRTSYRNSASKDYSGIRTTWLLCGTSSLRNIDQSELGERFLDCVIMEGIDDDLEDEILMRVANKAERVVGIDVEDSPDKQQDPEMTLAMQLTGGYVKFLRENSSDLLKAVRTPEWAKRKCTRLGKFVAYMRARPSTKQEETAEREFAARLVSQHMRLTKCLAAVLNKEEVDEVVMRRVRKVAIDTARGSTLEICKILYKHPGGSFVRPLETLTGLGDTKVRKLLAFLNKIGAVENFVKKSQDGRKGRVRWRLTERMRALYEEVMEDDLEP